MSKRVRVGDAEFLTEQDFERFGTFPRDALDNVVGDAIGWPAGWAGVTIARKSAQEVTVSPGRMFDGKIVYETEDAQTLNLTVFLPLAQTDEKYVALILRGRTEEIDEERAFETSIDVEVSEPVASLSPVIEHRTFEVVVQQGSAAPAPALLPTIAETDACIGFVRLTTQGVQDILPGEGWRVKSLHEVEGRVTILEAQMEIAFERTTTLATDLANVQARFSEIPRPEIIRQLQRDNARVRRMLEMPDEARAYFYDPGLSYRAWDRPHAAWMARVEEGVRFPWAHEREMQLTLQNPGASTIRFENSVLMPAWKEVRRIEVDGRGSTKNISQQVHTVTNAIRRNVSRSSVSFGPTVALCGNTAEYGTFDAAHIGQQFQFGGETFEKIAVIDSAYASSTEIDLNSFNELHGYQFDIDSVIRHNDGASTTGNRTIYAARSVQVDHWTETYWDYVTETFGINGSVYGQTFLVTQPMVMTSVELPFSRVGADGAVTVLLTEVGNDGSPMFGSVIARSTLPKNALNTGWVKFPFAPRYLPPGRRYAWVTVTTGNHALRTVTGASYSQGSLFWSTDSAWFQGSVDEDFAFRVNAAEFETTRAVVMFEPLTLENGMTEIKLTYESWVPDGTSLLWEIRPSGSLEWHSLLPETPTTPNPLRGLPALCELRLTMLGTTNLAPAIVLDGGARGATRRPRNDLRAISKPLKFGLTTTNITVELTMDEYDDLLHEVAPKVIVGTTAYEADTISISRDVERERRRTVIADFTVPSTTEARLQIEATTDNVQAVPFVENSSLFAL